LKARKEFEQKWNL